MFKGQAIKTKSDSNASGGGMFVYDLPNGTYLGALPTGNVIGFFVSEKTDSGTLWTRVKLLQLLKGKYAYAWIPSNKVYAWPLEPSSEYVIGAARIGVNVRNYPSLSSGIIKKLNAGQSVGKSDGYRVGDFILFNLTGGGYGWVHQEYVTKTASKSPVPTTNGNGPNGPETQPAPKEDLSLVIAKYARYAAFALSGVLVLLLIGNYFNNRKIKRSYERP